MGRTNLKEALERKFASLAGELKDKRGRIDHIEGLFQELPILSRRTERMKHLLHCAEELLKEIDPAWKREKVKPTRPHGYKEVPKGEGRRRGRWRGQAFRRGQFAYAQTQGSCVTSSPAYPRADGEGNR